MVQFPMILNSLDFHSLVFLQQHGVNPDTEVENAGWKQDRIGVHQERYMEPRDLRAQGEALSINPFTYLLISYGNLS